MKDLLFFYFSVFPDKAKGVFNYPTDNGRFDHEGERTVSDAVLIMRKHR